MLKGLKKGKMLKDNLIIKNGLSIFMSTLGASAYDDGLEPVINQSRHFYFGGVICLFKKS